MIENKLFTTVYKKEINNDEMSVVAWANKSDVIDRSGDLLLDSSWKLDNFMANPVIPAFHLYDRPPVAKALWVKVVPGQGLRFKAKFANSDEGKEFYSLYRDGIMSAFSIGFRPVSWIDQDEMTNAEIKAYSRNGVVPKRVFKSVELFEVSCVVVPDNQAALVERQANGEIKTKGVQDFIEFVKKSPEYIELIDEPTEEKAKKIGFIELEISEKEVVLPEKAEEESVDVTPEIDSKELGETINEDDSVLNKSTEEKCESCENEECKCEQPVEEKQNDLEGEIGDNLDTIEDRSEGEIDQLEKDASELTIASDSISTTTTDDKITIRDEAKVEEKSLDLIISEELEEAQKEVKQEQTAKLEEETMAVMKLFNGCRIKEVKDEDKEDVKNHYGDDFDITTVRTEPAGFELKIFCKYLNCKIKNIFVTDFYIPGAMKGNYLSGFKSALSKHELIDQRNFYVNATEIPLQFSVVKLNSKKSEEFLVEGTQFYKTKDGEGVIYQISRGWGGLNLNIFTSDKGIELNKSIAQEAVQWVKENNLLKGEKFSISGEFLETKNLGWDDVIFPSEDAKEKIKKNVEKLSKTSSSRGIMLIGPPGTGKTMTGKLLMKESDATFIWASSKDFKYGASGALALGFEMARELAPSIFFLEDIDCWLRDYTVDLLKTEMDGIRDNKGVLTVLTSNFPEDIPDALIDRPGRFHHILNFSLPDKENRIKLLKFFIKDADKVTIEQFAEKTNGYSGAHIKELVEFAKMIAEDEEISIEEALMKSLEQMKEQRQLIQNIKGEGKKKEVDETLIVNKEVEVIELVEDEKVIELDLINKEVDTEIMDLDPEFIKSVIFDAVKDSVSSTTDIENLVEERIKRYKGKIF